MVPSPLRAVEAVGVPVLTSSVDIANARLRFANGCIANVTASRVSLKRERKLRIFQADAYFSVDFDERRVRICRREPGADGQPSLTFEEREVAEATRSRRDRRLRPRGARARETPPVTGWDGLRALEVAHVIRESVETEARAAQVVDVRCRRRDPIREAERAWPRTPAVRAGAAGRRRGVRRPARRRPGDRRCAQRLPDVEVFGLGGERLREAGMRTVADSSEVATVGVDGGDGTRCACSSGPTARSRGVLREDPPDLCVLVDFPEFNLRLARVGQARRRAGPLLHRPAGVGVAARARAEDRAPGRPAGGGVPVRAAALRGPPAGRRVRRPSAARPRARDPLARGDVAALRLDRRRPYRRAAPGSRPKEIEKLLPPLLDAARRLAREDDCQFALALAHTLPREEVEARLAARACRCRSSRATRTTWSPRADLALVASGTATLECALLECPMVIVVPRSRR